MPTFILNITFGDFNGIFIYRPVYFFISFLTLAVSVLHIQWSDRCSGCLSSTCASWLFLLHYNYNYWILLLFHLFHLNRWIRKPMYVQSLLKPKRLPLVKVHHAAPSVALYISHILHQESWIICTKCFYLLFDIIGEKGSRSWSLNQPHSEYVASTGLKGNHRTQLSWGFDGVCSLLLVYLCGNFLLHPVWEDWLLQPPGKADQWCRSGALFCFYSYLFCH